MDINEMKRALLEEIERQSNSYGSYITQKQVLENVKRKLGINEIEHEQALLSVWGDLFRNGIIWWGHNVNNLNFEWIHITEKGKKALKNISRDPSNPEGYLNYISGLHINSVTDSYIREAVETYNNNCFKASAVMIGAASESVILELRDNMVSKVESNCLTVSSKLKDRRINIVINKISSEIEANKNRIPHELYESFFINWNSFIGQIRIARNDAGHPKSIYPVEEEMVHSNLLIFPSLVKLANELNTWIKNEY